MHCTKFSLLLQKNVRELVRYAMCQNWENVAIRGKRFSTCVTRRLKHRVLKYLSLHMEKRGGSSFKRGSKIQTVLWVIESSRNWVPVRSNVLGIQFRKREANFPGKTPPSVHQLFSLNSNVCPNVFHARSRRTFLIA